jgi:hypothetical protein
LVVTDDKGATSAADYVIVTVKAAIASPSPKTTTAA